MSPSNRRQLGAASAQPLPFIRTGRTSSCGTAILAVVTQNRAPSANVLANGQSPQVWQPQLWVRLIACVVAVLMGLGLMFPQVLNPSWVTGTPASELPWGLAMLGIALLLALGTWVSKVEVTSERVRIVNPWGVKSMQRSQVVDVRPGPWGVEFVTVGGRAFSAFAVQCTATSRGPRPRWVDIAEAVTGRTTYWPFNGGHHRGREPRRVGGGGSRLLPRAGIPDHSRGPRWPPRVPRQGSGQGNGGVDHRR